MSPFTFSSRIAVPPEPVCERFSTIISHGIATHHRPDHSSRHRRSQSRCVSNGTGCTRVAVKKTEEFEQCEERRGTNVKCSPMRWRPLDPSVHMCVRHMVKPGKDEMHR
ncbi:uncharacterized protein BO80DRAFT_128457 [Aspergillus ibericus CBS 121593]|uniref:Uncharacterized protein n=1 Tax=Aspergillus ibericus CBS 121593 TaxID=1448316 RepID=A0A395GUV7_9EURO|nr:hypothetical protein BO80DRAFT_128457 [Aspergillus ibericus CBS 121593]RAK99351.1 hypothetical protein BO80DRAFT_128457 [Aspergillus ibericus CBS 121593]